MTQKVVTFGVFVLLIMTGVFFMLGIKPSIPAAGLTGIWFYSGLTMVLFSMFYVEPYYSAPRNVLSHGITVLLVLVSVHGNIRERPTGYLWWRVLLIYAAVMIALSWAAMILPDSERPPNHWSNQVGELLKNITVVFGAGKILYSGVFVLFLPLLHDLNNPWVIATLVLWWLVVISDPGKRLAAAFKEMRHRSATLATIFSVQSSQVFVARVQPGGANVRVLDAVEFSYAVDDSAPRLRRGLVVDCYDLDDEKWIKIVQLDTCQPGSRLKDNEVRRLSGPEAETIAEARGRLVGLVCEGSDIRSVKFEVISGAVSIQEGDLVEILIASERVFYQVVNGTTDAERLEEKNESGFVRVDTVQLGVWNEKLQAFDAFGWVPSMNAPVLKAMSDMKIDEITPPEYLLGKVPGTNIPVAINLEAARTHHFAILGVTGSGKSFITLELVRQMINNTKVVCVDFTSEYAAQFRELNPRLLIDKNGLAQVEATMAKKADAPGKAETLKYRGQIEEKLDQYVREFMDDAANLAIFELPDLSNTTFILEFTQIFLDAIFRYAKTTPGKRICLVIEEAHTVIPETTSLGDFGDYSSNKALVNKIAQIALQGRKYGVGFWIIAQRTANVSKTVLTQCNSLLCFQAFDETSYRFLDNHLGSTMVSAIPRLKRYHAVAVGKAFRGNIPMIVDLSRPEAEAVEE